MPNETIRAVIALFFVAFTFSLSANDDSNVIVEAETEEVKTKETEESTLLEECYWQPSQPEITDCLKNLAADSAKKLTIAENEILSKINNSSWGKDGRNWENKYVDLAKKNLLKSKKEFLNFRRIHCNFDESLAFGATSSSHPQRQYSCQFKLNSWRIKQLQEML